MKRTIKKIKSYINKMNEINELSVVEENINFMDEVSEFLIKRHIGNSYRIWVKIPTSRKGNIELDIKGTSTELLEKIDKILDRKELSI